MGPDAEVLKARVYKTLKVMGATDGLRARLIANMLILAINIKYF